MQFIPPSGSDGRCPRTPFAMNCGFLALARWAADPDVIILARFKRLSCIPCATHGAADALRAAHTMGGQSFTISPRHHCEPRPKVASVEGRGRARQRRATQPQSPAAEYHVGSRQREGTPRSALDLHTRHAMLAT